MNRLKLGDDIYETVTALCVGKDAVEVDDGAGTGIPALYHADCHRRQICGGH